MLFLELFSLPNHQCISSLLMLVSAAAVSACRQSRSKSSWRRSQCEKRRETVQYPFLNLFSLRSSSISIFAHQQRSGFGAWADRVAFLPLFSLTSVSLSSLLRCLSPIVVSSSQYSIQPPSQGNRFSLRYSSQKPSF